MQVVIMRGIPGSGKTTIRKERYPNALVCSADDYHMVDGVYKFDPAKAGFAHAWCLKKFVLAVNGDLGTFANCRAETVVVDNTNSRVLEIAPYFRVAEAFGVPVKILRVHCQIEMALCRGTHNVPASTVFEMYANIMNEKLPPGWKEEIVLTGGSA